LLAQSSLKYQTRSCALFPNLEGYAIGSIEGRVGIDYMEDNNVTAAQGKKKYAFKCHRVDDTVYPVNAVAFHPTYGTFATGGCDGTVVVWDARLKKRLVALPRLATSVSALAFSKGADGGSLLAVAQSYTFEEGEKDHPSDQIFVRSMYDHEVKSKK
jgi:cell cycle arrest protein BUB3